MIAASRFRRWLSLATGTALVATGVAGAVGGQAHGLAFAANALEAAGRHSCAAAAADSTPIPTSISPSRIA